MAQLAPRERVDDIVRKIPDALRMDPDVKLTSTFVIVVEPSHWTISCTPAECTVVEGDDNETKVIYQSPEVFLDIFDLLLAPHVAFSKGLLRIEPVRKEQRATEELLQLADGQSSWTHGGMPFEHADAMATVMVAKRVFDCVRRYEASKPRPPPVKPGAPQAQEAVPSPVADTEAEVDQLRSQMSTLSADMRSLQEESASSGASALQRIGWSIILGGLGSITAIAWSIHFTPVRLAAGALIALAGYGILTPSWGPARRSRAFFTTAVIILEMRRLRQVTKDYNDAASDAAWSAANRVLARCAYEAMLGLRGMWLKVGQYLSSRSDVVPKEFVAELAKLQDSTESQPWTILAPMVEREWGCPVNEVLESVEEKALASASIAQVHRARLRHHATIRQPYVDPLNIQSSTGPVVKWRDVIVRDVVLKVQHPGIEDIMRQDLWTLSAIVWFVSWVEPEYNFSVVLGEWSREAEKELDFAREAALTRHSAGCLQVAGLPVRVPAIVGLKELIRTGKNTVFDCSPRAKDKSSKPFYIPDTPSVDDHPSSLATPHVLVAEYIQGVKVMDKEALKAMGCDVTILLSRIIESSALLMQVRGVFSGDPHPGNILVESSSGLPVLLDFGLTKVLTERERLAFCMMAVAASTASFDVLLDSFEVMGLKLSRESPEEDLQAIQFALRDTAPKDIARKRMMDRRQYWIKKEEERKAQQLKRPVESFPAGLLFYFRALNLLQGLGAGLDASAPFMRSLGLYSKAALRARSIGAMDGSWALHEAEPGAWLHFCARISHEVRRNSETSMVPVSILSMTRGVEARPLIETELLSVMHALQTSGELSGAQVAVVMDGKITVNVAWGELGPVDARPMDTTTLINAFSVTKGLTATLVHIMMEEATKAGVDVDYDTAVTEIWPEFSTRVKVRDDATPRMRALAAAKASTTIAHVLTHASGLAHALPAGITLEMLASLDAMMEAMEVASPVTKPGASQSYHYYTFGWLAAGICRGLFRLVRPCDRVPFSMSHLMRTYLLPRLPPECQDGMFIGLPLLLLPGELAASSGVKGVKGDTTMAEGCAPALEDAHLAKLCGSTISSGSGNTGIDVSRIEQALSDMEKARESRDKSGSELEDEIEDDATSDAHAMLELLRTLKERAYLMDPKLFNRRVVRGGEVPAANGHFTALALASFYAALGRPLARAEAQACLATAAQGRGEHEGRTLTEHAARLLGQGQSVENEKELLPLGRLVEAITPRQTSVPVVSRASASSAASAAFTLQRLFANDGSSIQSVEGGQRGQLGGRLSYGLGYHLYHSVLDDPTQCAFGHSGLGGSLALYSGSSNAGIAILVNQLSQTKVPTRKMLQVLEKHVPGLNGKLSTF